MIPVAGAGLPDNTRGGQLVVAGTAAFAASY